jgi:hypothetical protein
MPTKLPLTKWFVSMIVAASGCLLVMAIVKPGHTNNPNSERPIPQIVKPGHWN